MLLTVRKSLAIAALGLTAAGALIVPTGEAQAFGMRGFGGGGFRSFGSHGGFRGFGSHGLHRGFGHHAFRGHGLGHGFGGHRFHGLHHAGRGWSGGLGGFPALGMDMIGLMLPVGRAYISSEGRSADAVYFNNGGYVRVDTSEDGTKKTSIGQRKKAPRPLGSKRLADGGRIYFQQDRNTGQKFVQIEDANGRPVGVGGTYQGMPIR